MVVIIIIVMCDTTLIDFCLGPSVLAILCQMSPSRGVHSALIEEETQIQEVPMEVSFYDDDDDDDDDDGDADIYGIYIYICMSFQKMNEY